jgi:hypothetical protein
MRLIWGLFMGLFLSQISQAAILRGNPEGNIELIEVIDYQCPYCESDEPIVDEFLSRHPEVKLRLMPVAVINLTSIKEATAIFVSTNFAGKFESLHQQFLSKKLSDEAVDETLKEAGMDDSATLKAMHDPELQPLLQEGQSLLEK